MLVATLSELPHLRVTELGQVVDLFAEVGLVASKSAARRTVKEGDVCVNNVKVTVEGAVISAGKLLHGRWPVQRRGMRNLAASRGPSRLAELGEGANGVCSGQGEHPPRATGQQLLPDVWALPVPLSA